VSALVHSSTLVTAGVYLLIRFSYLLENSLSLKFLLFISITTIFMSGLSANFETDMKKIIALSTLRQLGVIIIILRIGQEDLAFFHLISHAIFKSILFVCGGSVIHMVDRRQDSRAIRSLKRRSPFLILVFSVRNLVLLGFPFLSGFYSKDIILEYMFGYNYNFFLYFLIIVATGITVSYRMRVMFLGIRNINNLKSVSNLEDPKYNLICRVMVLFFLRVSLGYNFS
jgi:NADH-ubiquinone oxidoreductase chain 5